MNREVHVRFWESPEVKVLRALETVIPSFSASPLAFTLICLHFPALCERW